VLVDDVDVSTPVRGHAGGRVELSVDRAGAAPLDEEGAARVELLDAVVARVRDEDVPAPVGRHAGGRVELSVARAAGSPRGGGGGRARRGRARRGRLSSGGRG